MITWVLESVATLPEGIDELARSARNEGFLFLDRLIGDHRTGDNMFARPGEVLFAVREDGRLVGIGGLNIDPFDTSGTTGRLRRLYVDPTCRGRGMGKALVRALESVAVQHFVALRLFTDDATAARFYLALGYSAVASDGQASHQKMLTEKSINQRRRACCNH
jgi:GNAT superfamily N-acetyltransferase